MHTDLYMCICIHIRHIKCTRIYTYAHAYIYGIFAYAFTYIYGVYAYAYAYIYGICIAYIYGVFEHVNTHTQILNAYATTCTKASSRKWIFYGAVTTECVLLL